MPRESHINSLDLRLAVLLAVSFAWYLVGIASSCLLPSFLLLVFFSSPLSSHPCPLVLNLVCVSSSPHSFRLRHFAAVFFYFASAPILAFLWLCSCFCPSVLPSPDFYKISSNRVLSSCPFLELFLFKTFPLTKPTRASTLCTIRNRKPVCALFVVPPAAVSGATEVDFG